MKNDDREGMVEKFVRFQRTGRGFGGVWNELEPLVRDFTIRNLAKRDGRRVAKADPWAIDDVVNSTALKLIELGRPGARGRFDPDRAGAGLSGFRGWLWRVVDSHVVNWWRDHVGGRAVKFLAASDLPLNQLAGEDQLSSEIDRAPAKFERPDLLPFLEKGIAQLPPNLARLVRLQLEEQLTQREIASRVGVSAPVVCRRLHKAYSLMRSCLEEAGFDDRWLSA